MFTYPALVAQWNVPHTTIGMCILEKVHHSPAHLADKTRGVDLEQNALGSDHKDLDPEFA